MTRIELIEKMVRDQYPKLQTSLTAAVASGLVLPVSRVQAMIDAARRVQAFWWDGIGPTDVDNLDIALSDLRVALAELDRKDI